MRLLQDSYQRHQGAVRLCGVMCAEQHMSAARVGAPQTRRWSAPKCGGVECGAVECSRVEWSTYVCGTHMSDNTRHVGNHHTAPDMSGRVRARG